LGRGIYIISWGLADRAEAGKPVSGPYFHRNIPPKAVIAAVTDWIWDDELFRDLGREMERPDLGGLDGFKFYAIRDEPLTQKGGFAYHAATGKAWGD
jgi:hypothetical protein